MSDAWVRVVALCVVLACAETLHGIVRTVLITPRIGKTRAIKLSAVTGSVLAFTICYGLVPPIGLSGLGQQLALGAGLAVFMALFDIAMAMLLLHKPWRKVAPDFDPRTGNYLLFGLIFLTFTPALVSAIRAPT